MPESGRRAGGERRIRLAPIGAEIVAPAGAPLRDHLFEAGVEFPCGGNGRCRGCKVRVVSGEVPVDDVQRERLSEAEIAEGWRLACRIELDQDLTLELRQWDATILSDEAGFAFTPQSGLGIAIDLGTTTLVAQLLDLATGQVLAVKSALNAQARYGGDVMSRVQHAVSSGGQVELQETIRAQIGSLIKQLFSASSHGLRVIDPRELSKIVLVGNTVMHHLYCGIDAAPMSRVPFEPIDAGLQSLDASTVGLSEIAPNARVRFLPCLGGFVGSDILAGILATGVAESDTLTCLLDLGTNGEIVLGNRNRILCASTAAGPAFEGARISMGMRASTGAIWRVEAEGENLRCEAIGGAAPRGICGSGLVDCVAACLDLGRIKPGGRLASPGPLVVAGDVALNQCDIRELQLAKGAIAAGIRILLKDWGAELDDVDRVFLAGAFGNYINRASARRIGLLPFDPVTVLPAGNTALLGAKIALGAPDLDELCNAVLTRVRHIGLGADAEFQEIYVDEMAFPD
jgi:uncharacterized 2Fe-2S/4Fe-4S cluster protein (DUF4445 family)